MTNNKMIKNNKMTVRAYWLRLTYTRKLNYLQNQKMNQTILNSAWGKKGKFWTKQME